MLHAQLVTVGFADGSVLARPRIPDVAVKLAYAVAFFLPNPQKLVQCRGEICLSYRDDGKFFLKVVAVYDTELFNGMRGRTVLPVRTDRHTLVRIAVFHDVVKIA